MKSKSLVVLRILSIIDMIGIMISLYAIISSLGVIISIMLIIMVQMNFNKIIEKIGLKNIAFIILTPIITPLFIIVIYTLYTIIWNNSYINPDELIEYIVIGEILILPISITIKNIIRIIDKKYYLLKYMLFVYI